MRYIVGRFHNFLQKKISTSIPFSFSAPYQPVLFRESHCHLSEQSFPLVEHSAHARAIFRGFASSREKSSRSRYEKMTHCTSHLHTISPPRPCLHCSHSYGIVAENESTLSFRYELDLRGSFQMLWHDDMAYFRSFYLSQ